MESLAAFRAAIAAATQIETTIGATHRAYTAEFDTKFQQWRTETDPAVKVALRRRLDELKVLGKTTQTALEQAAAAQNDAWGQLLSKVRSRRAGGRPLHTIPEDEQQRRAQAAWHSALEGLDFVDDEAWRRVPKPVKE